MTLVSARKLKSLVMLWFPSKCYLYAQCFLVLWTMLAFYLFYYYNCRISDIIGDSESSKADTIKDIFGKAKVYVVSKAEDIVV